MQHDDRIDHTIAAIRRYARDHSSWWVRVAHELADEVELLRDERAAALRLARVTSAAVSPNDRSSVVLDGLRSRAE